MQIKRAPIASESDVLKSAGRSNLITVALFAVGAGLAIVWSITEEKHRATVISVGNLALGGGLTAIRFYNKAIEDGRIDIGDLDPMVVTRALLSGSETQRLEQVKDFVTGTARLDDLPAVKQAIAAQMPKVDMHQKVAELALEQGLISPPKKIVVSNPQDAI